MDTESNGDRTESMTRNKAVSVGKEIGAMLGRCEAVLRVSAMALTLSAAVILGVNRESKLVAFEIVDSLPPIKIPVSAKWHYLSAFLYFVVANAVACIYGALSLALTFAKRGGKSAKVIRLVLVSLDAVMVGLIFSSAGAAAAIGVMGFEGNSHVQWKKVCHVFSRFCNQAATAIGVSLLGGLAFLALIIIAAKRLHK